MKKTAKLVSLLLLVALIASCLFAFTACDDESNQYAPYLVSSEKTFVIDGAKTQLFELPVAVALNAAECKVVLRTDGTMTMRFIIGDTILDVLKNWLNLDIGDMIGGVDVSPFIGQYVDPLFPGFTLDDIQGSMALIDKSVGIKLVGIDFEDENIINLCDSLKNTGKVPEGFEIPNGLGIEINCPYVMQKVHSDYSGDYTAVFMGERRDTEETFSIFTYEKNNKTGKMRLHLRIEFINLDFYANEV